MTLRDRSNMIWTSKVRSVIGIFGSYLKHSMEDKEWLDAVNVERKRDQLDAVSYSSFEVIMDRLEKEWFDLVSGFSVAFCYWLTLKISFKTKNMPKLDMALPSEDSTCAICDDSEGENSNAIVFCDGCNLAVHQGENACMSFNDRLCDDGA